MVICHDIRKSSFNSHNRYIRGVIYYRKGLGTWDVSIILNQANDEVCKDDEPDVLNCLYGWRFLRKHENTRSGKYEETVSDMDIRKHLALDDYLRVLIPFFCYMSKCNASDVLTGYQKKINLLYVAEFLNDISKMGWVKKTLTKWRYDQEGNSIWMDMTEAKEGK